MEILDTRVLIEKLQAAEKCYFEDKIEQYPRNNFTASQIHECDMFMVLSILRWRDQDPHDWKLQRLFHSGNVAEDNVSRLLQDFGYPLLRRQEWIEFKFRKDIILRGRIDGYIGKQLIEIKSTNPYTFKKIKTVLDFSENRLYNRYLAQATMYMHMLEEPTLLFILTDGKEIKYIPYEYAKSFAKDIIERLKTLWGYVKKEYYPDYVTRDEKCADCSFTHICDAKKVAKKADIIN